MARLDRGGNWVLEGALIASAMNAGIGLSGSDADWLDAAAENKTPVEYKGGKETAPQTASKPPAPCKNKSQG